MNLHICDWESDGKEVTEIMWRMDNLDGSCYVRDGRVETPQLCDDMHIELRPSAIREIRKLCQEWVDTKPARDLEHKNWEERFEYVKGNWEKWEDGLADGLQHAIPSVDKLPHEIAIEGPVTFVAFDEDCNLVYCANATSPTWSIVLLMFDTSITLTDDTHHCFLEGLHKHGRWDYMLPDDFPTDRPVYCFSTGS